MPSVVSDGATDRIVARILFKVLRAGSETLARYSSMVFGTDLPFLVIPMPRDAGFGMVDLLTVVPVCPLDRNADGVHACCQEGPQLCDPELHHNAGFNPRTTPPFAILFSSPTTRISFPSLLRHRRGLLPRSSAPGIGSCRSCPHGWRAAFHPSWPRMQHGHHTHSLSWCSSWSSPPGCPSSASRFRWFRLPVDSSMPAWAGCSSAGRTPYDLRCPVPGRQSPAAGPLSEKASIRFTFLVMAGPNCIVGHPSYCQGSLATWPR